RTARTVIRPGLVIEELSDFRDSDCERPGVIRPIAIEQQDSDRSQRIRQHKPEGYEHITRPKMSSVQDSSSGDSFNEVEYQEFLRRQRQAKRRRRTKTGGRTISEALGSDSDEEDLRLSNVRDPGSSARRLRRRTDHRGKTAFEAPPLRISELEEPESPDDALAQELPYFEYRSMEADS
ncbi:hypothetical protein QBC34DRAFT_279672, partial [Podospora aff. communis PSN243]